MKRTAGLILAGLLLSPFAPLIVRADICVSVYSADFKGTNGWFETRCTDDTVFKTSLGGWFDHEPRHKAALEKITATLASKGQALVGTYFHGIVTLHSDEAALTQPRGTVCLLAREGRRRSWPPEHDLDCGEGAITMIEDARLSDFLRHHGYQFIAASKSSMDVIMVRDRFARKDLHVYVRSESPLIKPGQ